MYSWENPDDRVAIVEMNSALRHAQLELLSAHCASHQLRLRFSADDLARFGQRDLLRKSVQTASALSEYYSSIEKKVAGAAVTDSSPVQLSEEQILEAARKVAAYLRQQRDYYSRAALPLDRDQKVQLSHYFPPALLDEVRIVELLGTHVPNPPFYAEAIELGFVNLPQIAHMSSITFLDVIVFHQKFMSRNLFHALVHAVQFQILGVERYAELFVRSFVNTKFHFSVPFEAQAFALESRFAGHPSDRFSVEDQVRLWDRQSRY
jgi:hypothetical protein